MKALYINMTVGLHHVQLLQIHLLQLLRLPLKHSLIPILRANLFEHWICNALQYLRCFTIIRDRKLLPFILVEIDVGGGHFLVFIILKHGR